MDYIGVSSINIHLHGSEYKSWALWIILDVHDVPNLHQPQVLSVAYKSLWHIAVNIYGQFAYGDVGPTGNRMFTDFKTYKWQWYKVFQPNKRYLSDTRDIVLCIWIDLNMVKLCQDKGFFLFIFAFEQQL